MEAEAFPTALLLAFPFLFVGFWLLTVTLLGLFSGWFGLLRRFPDQHDEALAKFGSQSGVMGLGVGYNGVLTLTVCRGGLRVGVWRIFGPFCGPFYVPWRDLRVRRRRVVMFERADLEFADAGKLTVAGDLADRIARAADRTWPEPGPRPPKKVGRLAMIALAEWAISTAVVGGFFTLAPLLAGQGPSPVPPVLTIGFPAVAFAVIAVFRFLRRVAG